MKVINLSSPISDLVLLLFDVFRHNSSTSIFYVSVIVYNIDIMSNDPSTLCLWLRSASSPSPSLWRSTPTMARSLLPPSWPLVRPTPWPSLRATWILTQSPSRNRMAWTSQPQPWSCQMVSMSLSSSPWRSWWPRVRAALSSLVSPGVVNSACLLTVPDARLQAVWCLGQQLTYESNHICRYPLICHLSIHLCYSYNLQPIINIPLHHHPSSIFHTYPSQPTNQPTSSNSQQPPCNSTLNSPHNPTCHIPRCRPCLLRWFPWPKSSWYELGLRSGRRIASHAGWW